METRGGNFVAENVTENIDKKIPEQYLADNLMTYQVSLSLIDKLAEKGSITATERRKAYKIITKRHGLSLDSIFAESA